MIWNSFILNPFVIWFQQRIIYWSRHPTPSLVSGVIPDLTHNRADLIVENALLRQ
jgi:hypothetical protein